jgi:hypothetical protein
MSEVLLARVAQLEGALKRVEPVLRDFAREAEDARMNYPEHWSRRDTAWRLVKEKAARATTAHTEVRAALSPPSSDQTSKGEAPRTAYEWDKFMSTPAPAKEPWDDMSLTPDESDRLKIIGTAKKLAARMGAEFVERAPAQGTAESWPDDAAVEREWQALLDKDDRTSPEEYPEMVLITREEVAALLASTPPAKDEIGCAERAAPSSKPEGEAGAMLEWPEDADGRRTGPPIELPVLEILGTVRSHGSPDDLYPIRRMAIVRMVDEIVAARARVPAGPKISDADTWIEWNGGKCPVAPKTVVEVRFRCGESRAGESAGEWSWKHSRRLDTHDIVAYRVARP